jgi:YqjK-like protein
MNMNEKLIKLAERRATLIARAENQRDTFARASVSLRAPLALADRGLDGIHYLKQHPEWLAGTAVLALLLRPRRIFKWAQRGWMAWHFTRSLKRKLYGN